MVVQADRNRIESGKLQARGRGCDLRLMGHAVILSVNFLFSCGDFRPATAKEGGAH